MLPEGNRAWYNNGLGMAMLKAVAAAITLMAGCDISGLANIGDDNAVAVLIDMDIRTVRKHWTAAPPERGGRHTCRRHGPRGARRRT